MQLNYVIKNKRFYSTSEAQKVNHSLGRAVRIHDYNHALSLLSFMKDNNIRIKPAQYDMVLRLYCDENQLKSADKFLANIDCKDVVQANAVLHVHCRNDDKAGALSFFKAMKDKLGINHDEQSYLEIIRFLSKEQEPSKCLEYLWKMKQEGLTPSIPIYTDVLYCLAKAGKYQDAINIYNNMRIPPEAIIYNLVLEIATLAHDAVLCEKLVRGMWEKGINIHPQIFDPIRTLAMKDKSERHKELTLE